MQTSNAKAKLSDATLTLIKRAITQHALPIEFLQTVQQHYAPIAAQLDERTEGHTRTLLIGIQGTQGSGKSTMADFLKVLLTQEHHLTVAVVSIDDFYHTAETRQQLAEDIHPLLATRGVPGTHDLPLAFSTLNTLTKLKMGEHCALPRFNKAVDDRVRKRDWPTITGPVDVVIFEGWCVGITPQNSEELVNPINQLELNEDPEGIWRTYVNTQLGEGYAKLFNQLDYLISITAPSFDVVFEWRSLQEQKLAQKLQNAPLEEQAKLLDDAQLRRFIAHYQRLTCHGLKQLPQTADWVIHLNKQHTVTHSKDNCEQRMATHEPSM